MKQKSVNPPTHQIPSSDGTSDKAQLAKDKAKAMIDRIDTTLEAEQAKKAEEERVIASQKSAREALDKLAKEDYERRKQKALDILTGRCGC